MLLAIDIGNSNIVFGGIYNDKIIFQFRIATDYIKTQDQYELKIKNLLHMYDIKSNEIFDCIISSVVPPVFNSIHNAVKNIIKKNPMIVKSDMQTKINICTDNPTAVGSDLIVTAAAAITEYEPPLIIIDMGTATTITVVDEDNLFLGGAIIPGIQISMEALINRAAQLPAIQLKKPLKIIGKNTIDSMCSGIMYGTASMLDGMIERMEKELGKEMIAIVTGGMAEFIVPICNHEMYLEKDLLLKGLNIIYKSNKKS